VVPLRDQHRVGPSSVCAGQGAPHLLDHFLNLCPHFLAFDSSSPLQPRWGGGKSERCLARTSLRGGAPADPGSGFAEAPARQRSPGRGGTAGLDEPLPASTPVCGAVAPTCGSSVLRATRGSPVLVSPQGSTRRTWSSRPALDTPAAGGCATAPPAKCRSSAARAVSNVTASKRLCDCFF